MRLNGPTGSLAHWIVEGPIPLNTCVQKDPVRQKLLVEYEATVDRFGFARLKVEIRHGDFKLLTSWKQERLAVVEEVARQPVCPTEPLDTEEAL